ncbi:MAG: COG3014 family protein, partial [Bacteroidota bacterium]
LVILTCLITACATYYEKNAHFMQAIYDGNLQSAEELIAKTENRTPSRNMLLYYLNYATVLSLNNKPSESNREFQKADYFVEDFQKNLGASALSLLTNPGITPYAGEPFEQILLHYYTTINYIKLGDFDAALVECKRMNLKLQRITDTYKERNVYRRDAFVHLLNGIIYDAQKDYNNAFIAYRNAIEVYESDYSKLGCVLPNQLKDDIIRTAYLTGFYDEQYFYEQRYNRKLNKDSSKLESHIFFWNNGLCPIKDEWSINFVITQGNDGWVNFVNVDLGLNFPFYVGENDTRKSLSDLKIVRVAFPKFVSRSRKYFSAEFKIDSLNYAKQFELAEPVNQIAYQSLRDRMMKEMAEALLRLATKQILETQMRKKNEGLGIAMSILNAVSEQADTRNWQLLPFEILYTRIQIPAGRYKYKVDGYDESRSQKTTIALGEMSVSQQSAISTLNSMNFTGYVR